MCKPTVGFYSLINLTTAVSDVIVTGQDMGKTKIQFSSSVIAGDNYILVAQIKNQAGNVLKEQKTANWTVRKTVSFSNIYQMAGSFNMGQMMSFNNVDAAFSGDGCTDYSLNATSVTTLSASNSPKFLVSFLPPIPLIDTVTGQPNPNTELPTAKELQDYNHGTWAAKDSADTLITRKAQRWFNRNNNNLSRSINAYVQGIYVMLDVTGTIANYTNCGGYYANYDFYDNIADQTKRNTLIATITQFVKNNKFDGVNIYLNNISEGLAFKDPGSVTTFFNDLHTSLTLLASPKGQMFYSASVPTGWTSTVLSMVASNNNFDWVNVYGFASQDLTPIPSSPAWYLSDAINAWVGLGIPASKIIGGIPAFGRSYNFPDGVAITWGNVDTYASWIGFKSIISQNANAANLNPSQFNVTPLTGVFYDGFSNIDAKTQFIMNNNMGGVMIWSINNDSMDPTKSLVKRAYDNLNPAK